MTRFTIWTLLLIAFALRLWTLGDKAVWWDEAWSVWVAQQPFVQTTEITARDVHPPLYQWALHAWVRVAGESEFAVRYLSVMWSLLTAAVVYVLARRFAGQRAGLLALLFTASSVFFIHWAQETRMYAQAALLCALVSYAYLRLISPSLCSGEGRGGDVVPLWLKNIFSILGHSIHRELEPATDHTIDSPPPFTGEAGRRLQSFWPLLILSGAGVALTHYLGAFVLVILNIHWLLTFNRRSRAFHLRWMASMIIIGLILVAWVIYALPLTRSGNIDNDFSAALVFQLAATLLAVGTSVNLEQYTLIALFVVVVFFAGLLLSRRALLVWLMALLPPLAIYGLSLLQTSFYSPKPEERYLIIFAPVVFAGVGVALDAILRRSRIIGGVAAAALLILYAQAYLRDLDTRYMRDDYAMMLRTVDLLAQSDEPVLFVSDDRYPLVYYHLHRPAAGITSPTEQVHNAHMLDLLDGADRFWVIQIERHFRDPEGLTIQWFDSRYQRILDIPIDYNRLTLYSSGDMTRPDSDEILPPVIKEARPGDTVRIGAPGLIEMLYGDHIVMASESEGWRLEQFPIYPAYPSGSYQIITKGQSYSFAVTHTFTPAAQGKNLMAILGNEMMLKGVSVDNPVKSPGETFEVTLFWEALERPTRNYTVFLHLLGPFTETGPVWAGDDSYPAQTPTTALWKGITFNETRRLTIPANMPPGTYEVELGLYVLETGERLKLPNGDDHIIIPGFVVES